METPPLVGNTVTLVERRNESLTINIVLIERMTNLVPLLGDNEDIKDNCDTGFSQCI